MRTRLIVPALALVLVWCASAGGCQIIAGLTPLEVTGGAGGQSGTGGHGGSGGGPQCVKDTDCGPTHGCLPWSCDHGACVAKKAPPGTSCSGTCVGSTLALQGTCDDDGQCMGQTQPCAMDFACNADGTACNTTCATSADCASTGFCAPGPHLCLACGATPPSGGCGATCDACDNGTCVTACGMTDACDKSEMFDTGVAGVRIECKDRCNDITLSCGGPHPCEVVCEQGGCNHLTFRCADDGPCKITCHGGSCFGLVVECGGNTCEAACDGGNFVDQQCGHSCSCTKDLCL